MKRYELIPNKTWMPAWDGFQSGNWNEQIDVENFINLNFSAYEGGHEFLAGPSKRTQLLWEEVLDLMKQERAAPGGVLDTDTTVVSGIASHGPGYINKDLEQIVGLQTDKPLKRGFIPFGGFRMAKQAAEAYGYTVDPMLEKSFQFRKTHNDGVFDVYTDAMKEARRSAIITGLPDAYGRGRIIGDYRRVALYGIDALIADKQNEYAESENAVMNEEIIRLREELAEQIKALKEMIKLGDSYGFDLRRPAQTAKEAIQWTYLAYLAAAKEQNGAAMSLGRTSTFLDIFVERDLKKGLITEEQAQEMVDHFIMKLRMVRFARTPDYNDLFSGDPTWVTESIGGVNEQGKPLVTKNSFRFLHTLYNLGPAPEPNLTVLWSEKLPEGFKRFCAKVSIDTSSVQYESDDLMRPIFGGDYGIACCVSAMKIGKQMQFFGARANLAKALLYSMNQGRDEISGEQIAPSFPSLASDVLDYDEVMRNFDKTLDWLTRLYVNTLNVIHYMHDKYCYERSEMALHDRDVERKLACGIAGLSVVADSLSAIKYAKVQAIRNSEGLITDFKVEGDFPRYGNNDERVDSIAVDLVRLFNSKIQKQQTYRKANPTLSVLTITSNVVYGKKTGNTPDGRKTGEPFAPGANPMHGRDQHGALASLESVAHLPYESALDGISNTFSIVPAALGKTEEDRIGNLVNMLDGYIHDQGHHININVLNRETLLAAMEHPEQYPQLTIRVSGYAVNFIKLTREQQIDVINRTFHKSM
jgi:formate C-acetyltransferase